MPKLTNHILVFHSKLCMSHSILCMFHSISCMSHSKSIKISSKTVIHPGKAILSSNVWIKSVMGTGIAFGRYNVIVMRSITDRVTRAKSDTKYFRNKRLCSSTLWGIYKEG